MVTVGEIVTDGLEVLLGVALEERVLVSERVEEDVSEVLMEFVVVCEPLVEDDNDIDQDDVLESACEAVNVRVDEALDGVPPDRVPSTVSDVECVAEKLGERLEVCDQVFREIECWVAESVVLLVCDRVVDGVGILVTVGVRRCEAVAVVSELADLEDEMVSFDVLLSKESVPVMDPLCDTSFVEDCLVAVGGFVRDIENAYVNDRCDSLSVTV